ncbi:polyisoprenoid diphosphate/phosphate phosphohydrolase PLPP6-like [Haemaphysalis longicornis]
MKRSVVGAKPDGDHLVGEDKDPKNRDLPPPGWKRNPWLLMMKGVDELISAHLFLAATETAPLAKYRKILSTFELSAHCAIWFGGLLFLTWFFSVDRALRTFFLNVFLALFIDVVLVAVLKAATRRRRPGVSREQYEREPLSSNLSFPSGFTSRAFLVTLIVVKHSHLFPLFKLPFLLWCMAVAVCKLLMGRQFLGDSLAGVVLGYVEYYWIVCPLWMSERTASLFYNSFSTL